MRACRETGDLAGEEAAIRSRLSLDGRDIRALLAMGDLFARTGDDRAACSHFRVALKCASGPAGCPSSLHGLLRDAMAFVKAAEARFTAELQETIRQLAPRGGTTSPRVTKAIKLLLGETPLHLQQPSLIYFPELAQRPFFEREEFEWIPQIEARMPEIRDEVLNVLENHPQAFAPHTVENRRIPLPGSSLLNDPSWSVMHLWQNGVEQQHNLALVPRTVEALSAAPAPSIGGFAPMVMFSLLRPGTHIPRHHGVANIRLVCHLPLIVPDGCAIRVGGETRTWEEGRMLVFDDSFEHEAWNRGTGTRVVLLFDVWRPDITRDERDQITALIEAAKLSDLQLEAA